MQGDRLIRSIPIDLAFVGIRSWDENKPKRSEGGSSFLSLAFYQMTVAFKKKKNYHTINTTLTQHILHKISHIFQFKMACNKLLHRRRISKLGHKPS